MSRTLLVALFMLMLTPQAWAQPRWHTDYEAARNEATATKKPLFFKFRSQNCLWCDKLEQNALRNPEVVSLLTERFVCLKVESEKEPFLVSALNIYVYPTIVVGRSDGKGLVYLNGYQEVGPLLETMRKFLPARKLRLALPVGRSAAPTGSLVIGPGGTWQVVGEDGSLSPLDR